MFAIARCPTPAYNRPDFPEIYQSKILPFDDQGLFRPLEFVARKNTKFVIQDKINSEVYRVRTNDYPEELFIHKHFLEEMTKEPPERQEPLPHLDTMLSRLDDLVSQGDPYVWGGNSTFGIPEIATLFPVPFFAEERIRKIFLMKGYDCSGLIYDITCGNIPRNSAGQIKMGVAVDIEYKNADEVNRLLQPGDLIGWKGHVLIKGRRDLVESRLQYGVIKIDPITRLKEIMETRRPVNDYVADGFVVRRWYHLISETRST